MAEASNRESQLPAKKPCQEPGLLLGDELTGNLDSKTSSMVMEVLVKACEAERITCVLVTHDGY